MTEMRLLIEGLAGVLSEAAWSDIYDAAKKDRRREAARISEQDRAKKGTKRVVKKTSTMGGKSVADFQKGAKDFQVRNAYHSSHWKGADAFAKGAEGYKAEPTSRRKGKDVGGAATMPGPDGADVAGKWVTSRGKRLFFPDAPGGDIPEGPWGGGPGRPGWTSKGGTFVARKGVMPQKGQLSLFGKSKGKAKTEARTYGGRPLSEQLGAYLVEYKTKGWSTVPDKSGKVYKTTPPGKKGVWRTVRGRHVFFPQDGSGPIGGAPGRAGWTKRSGKYHEAGQKPAQKTAKTTKRGQR